MTTSAVVFVLSKYLTTDANQCLDYCAAQGYAVAGIVHDNWAAVMETIAAGLATIVVVAHVDRLDETCVPRMEVVADRPPAAAIVARRRRTTRIIRRGGGA